MKTSHTKGPWKLTESGSEIVGATTRFNGKNKLAAICILDESENKEEDLYNARLISAAPELLWACKELLNEIKKSMDSRLIPLRHKCLVAIAKAEGKLIVPNPAWKSA